MLGNSGAGKTTYLSLMYAEMSEGVAGFQVRARSDAHHQVLMKDARGIRTGVYPAVTHRRASYDLALRYNGTEVLPFSWQDHRGGAASGRTSDADDVAELHRDLLDSDAILMFADGSELVSSPRAAKAFGRLSGPVLRALNARGQVPTPVVIVVTKCDLVNLRDPKVLEAVRAPLRELIGAIRDSKHIHGTVQLVSCGPSPSNVIYPALWSLRWGVLGMRERLDLVARRHSAAAKAAAKKNTLINRLAARFWGVPTNGDIALEERLYAQQAYQKLDALIQPVQGLDKLLADVSSF
jgi:hypothetical protein